MDQSSEFDFIIAGGGLSGLSFLYEILSKSSFSDKRILIIDSERRHLNDRTWSFWERPEYNIPTIPSKQWKYGKLIDRSGDSINFNFDPFKYRTIRSSDYYQFIYDYAANRSNVVFYYDNILSCHPSGLVECSNAFFKGKLVIKSYYNKDKFQIPLTGNNTLLWQHFKGWIIQTPQEIFQEDTVILMDYRIAKKDVTQFVYVLPFSKTEALIEYTEFSNRDFKTVDSDDYIKNYIKDYLCISDYLILEQEISSIPMTDYMFKPLINDKVINIGTNAGYVKPSSGYCFTRTILKVRNLVALLDNKKISVIKLRPRFSFWLFDSILLESISKGVFQGHDVFTQLFRKQNEKKRISLVFKFLDEKTTFLENIKIIFSMPKKLSLTCILLKGIFSGKYFKKFYF